MRNNLDSRVLARLLDKRLPKEAIRWRAILSANPVEGRAMRSVSWKIKLVCATIGLAMSMEQSAHAASSVILRTPSVVPDPKGHLDCTASATSTTPIGMVAVIMSSSRTNVTDYGTGFRASPAATGDGLYHADETAGSFSNRARYCKVTVMGANLADVHVSLKAYDANDECTETIVVQ